MRKLAIVLIIVILVVSFVASSKKFDPETYVSEGLQTSFGILVDSNQMFYNEVFALGHLKTDKNKTVKEDGKKWVLVTDSRFPTYEALREGLSSTYTEDCVVKILIDYPIYKDIDGKLYLDADATPKEGVKWVRDKEREAEFEGRTENSYTMEYRFTAGKKDELDEFTFRRDTASYRITEFIYVD